MTALGDTTAPVRDLKPYVSPRYPHIFTGRDRRRWCRIVPGRVGPRRDRWVIELDDGEQLEVPARVGDGDLVERTEPCPKCNATGSITYLPAVKEPAVTVRCDVCKGSTRRVRLPPFPKPVKPPADITEDRTAHSHSPDPVSRPGAIRQPSGKGRINITGPGDWSRSSRGRGDWS